MSENFDDIEKMLKSKKIKSVPPHLLARFSEEVLERIEAKPRARFEWRLFPVLVPAAAVILLAVFLLPDLKHRAPATAQAPRAVQTAKAPLALTLEQEMRLLEDFGSPASFEIADAGYQIQKALTVEEEMKLLEDFGANNVEQEVLTDEEVILYDMDVFSSTSARG